MKRSLLLGLLWGFAAWNVIGSLAFVMRTELAGLDLALGLLTGMAIAGAHVRLAGRRHARRRPGPSLVAAGSRTG